MKTRNIIFWTILLILTDQVVKLVIYHSLMNVNYIIIPNVLEFKPVFNPGYSYWTQKVGANMGLIAHLILFSFIWAAIIFLYKYYHKVDPKNRLLDGALVFQLAGFASAYISILFWKEGVLDFIYFNPLNVTCDLKDLYINIFIVLWIISTSIIAVKFQTKAKDIIKYAKSFFTKK